MRHYRGVFGGIIFALVLSWAAGQSAEEQAPHPRLVLPGYRTVAEAIRADPKQFRLDVPSTPAPAGFLGVVLAEKNGAVVIEEVALDSPAEVAGLQPGDRLLSLDGQPVRHLAVTREYLRELLAGQTVKLTIERNGRRQELVATLRPVSAPLSPPERPTGKGPAGKFAGWDDRLPRAWRKPVYRLAVLGIEYPDVAHNPKITPEDWNRAFFSIDSYKDKSPTGEKVYGSMRDYYHEVSYGKLQLEGQFLGWVKVSKKRQDYSTGSSSTPAERRALLVEALDLYTAKHGKDALQNYDGVCFLYAGSRVQTSRGGLYWPHRANVTYQGRSIPYFIVPEGGNRMTDISVCCHEFGHLLGLPDLYARPEQPGSEGVWQWCVMSNQLGGGRPQHPSAWCKEQLGWIQPAVLDPRVPQKLILQPIWNDPTQCYKVMVRPDGTEYFLLEYRTRNGWDAGLPAEGLLIWRVFAGVNRGGQPVYLEESHGIEGASGPRLYPESVPFPSRSNNSFTPFTIPSSKSQLGGGLPVWITNIRKLPDGRITFHIGYEYN
ncbi:MAG: M6 family metalloprotease domain-containing protein [Gemmataceae bacterium]|nr:M6 family metalloprotease domain-containing protein [Gemmataceae bacterium]MCS7269794.1 M6 family metalloprotease domain-containing protein [Gemmataceae bacterium]MDW8242593.1 M6 family metalloprotease domain-containing protein [Thermogemmata sp.]